VNKNHSLWLAHYRQACAQFQETDQNPGRMQQRERSGWPLKPKPATSRLELVHGHQRRAHFSFCSKGITDGTYKSSPPRSVTHPASYPMDFRGVKRPGPQDIHSPPSSAGIECVELYLHSPTRLCIACCLVETRVNFVTVTKYFFTKHAARVWTRAQ
jgi:hypothetical protein